VEGGNTGPQGTSTVKEVFVKVVVNPIYLTIVQTEHVVENIITTLLPCKWQQAKDLAELDRLIRAINLKGKEQMSPIFVNIFNTYS